MQITKCTVLSLLLVVVGSAASIGPVSLNLTMRDSTIKSGSKVVVRATTTNESDHVITYNNTRRDCDYSVTVLTASGTSAAETSYKKQLKCGGGPLRITGRNIIVTLKPAESSSEQIDISALYDMTAPGEYSIQVERTFAQIGQFSSNLLKVRVTQ